MKKLLSIFLSIYLCLNMVSITAHADEKNTSQVSTVETTTETETETETELVPVLLPTDKVSTEDFLLYSSSCCVMDVKTGAVLYYKNMNDKHYPASITKVMTALLTIENANLKDKVTFGEACWKGLNYYEDMNIGMLTGEELTVNACLYAMLLSSANEVCNQIAIYLDGSIKAFADRMNERALELGCKNTHFSNPSGLHSDDHYTTAYDMALIASEAIKHPTFRKITGSYEYTVKSTNKRPEGFVLSHKHRMLMYTNYHYDACIGGKTGYTEKAKNTLVTYAEKNGMELVCVVMENADGHIYPDTITALDYCFDNYSAQNLDLSSSAVKECLPSLPFSGIDNSFVQLVSNPDYSVDVLKETSQSDIQQALSLHPSDGMVAPYKNAVYVAGTVSLDNQTLSLGNIPIYAVTEQDSDQMSKESPETPVVSNQKPSVDIQLRDTSVPNNLRQTISDQIITMVYQYMPWSIAVLIGTFMLLSILLIWLKNVCKRLRHRHTYKKMRKKRIESRTNSKNK